MRADMWMLSVVAALGLSRAGIAQSPGGDLPGGAADANGGMARMPGRPGAGVAVVVDPFGMPSPAEMWARQVLAEYDSRPIYMDENDWRLPTAKELHDRMYFRKAPPDPVVVIPSSGKVEVLGTGKKAEVLGGIP